MKKTGTTNDRNIIVEMSEDEYRALGRLALAVEGKTLDDMAPYREPRVIMPDMTTVIGAVEAFTCSKALLNELVNIIKWADKTLVERIADREGKAMSDSGTMTFEVRKRLVFNYLEGYENVVSVEEGPTEGESITIYIGWQFSDGGVYTSLATPIKSIMEIPEGVLSRQIYNEHKAALGRDDEKSK